MIDEKYIELMNKEIDKVITYDEKIVLDNFMAGNTTAKNYYDELLLTNNYLNEIPDHNPSENLKKRILNSIDFSRYAPKIKSRKSFNFLWGLKPRYAITFAAGLLAGIIIYALFNITSNNVNQNDIYGTMGAADNLKTIQEIQLNFSNISGKIELKEQGNIFWFDISADTPEKTDFIVTYPEQVHFDNIKPESVSNIELSNSKNYIKITNSGSQQYSLQFSQNNQSSPPMHVRIVQSGNTVYDHELLLKR